MAILYADSASFNIVTITNSIIMSGSSSITGSLFGTASFATTASYALSSAGGGATDTTAVEAYVWFLS